MGTALVILAAGKGTRMMSDLPKVLHKIAGAPLLVHAMASGAALEPEHVIVIAGHEADAVRTAAQEHDETAQIVLQTEQKGTGHAVSQARGALADFDGDMVVLYGDTPFIQSETLEKMAAARQTHDIVVLGFEAADPARYGRLIIDGDDLTHIVEFKDASDEERAVTLCNSGVLMGSAQTLFNLLDQITNDNAAGEYYLTDVVAMGRSQGHSAKVVTCPEHETMGVNSRADLAMAEAAFQTRARADLLDLGVTLTAPDTVFLSFDTHIGRDAEVEPNVVFGPGVTVESGALIRSFSHLEGCHVSRGARVGPYARLRTGTELDEDVHVGNFVEIKNAHLHEGVKAGHLTYLGDAEIGAGSNIGAGTITCNYDGILKHRTEIGARAFIGSNTMLVAPVRVGSEALTGSGSVITDDVPDGALAIARAEQVNKPGLARKLMQVLRAKKAKMKGDS